MERGHGNPYWMDGGRYAHDEWWHGPLQLVLFLLVVAALVLGVVWLVRTLRRSAPGAAAVPGATVAPALAAAPTSPLDPAVAELRLRYARGDVDRETYLRAFADLTGRGEPWPGQAGAEAPTAEQPADG